MTLMPRLVRPARGPTASSRPRHGRRSRSGAPRERVARALLNATAAVLMAGCLPPDFEVAPRENHPVTIDKSLLTYSPDEFQEIPCSERVFDLQGAISDEDGDRIQIAWILGFEPNLNMVPDVVGQFRFTYRPCFTDRVEADVVQTLEVLVFDRPLPPGLTVDELKEFAEDDVTSDSVVWFVRSRGSLCCPTVGP